MAGGGPIGRGWGDIKKAHSQPVVFIAVRKGRGAGPHAAPLEARVDVDFHARRTRRLGESHEKNAVLLAPPGPVPWYAPYHGKPRRPFLREAGK